MTKELALQLLTSLRDRINNEAVGDWVNRCISNLDDTCDNLEDDLAKKSEED